MGLIQFKDVWEMYRIKFVLDGKVSLENFWALSGINFKIEKGESVGIIGENGSGKSTILKLIMGMLMPDRGEVRASGRVSGLLELGAGFQPELTGRENIYLNAGMFGLGPREIEAVYGEIVNFAELGKFINAPVKCFSQGMFVRLAFSIAIHVNPEVLLIDDSLAVGDEYFQKKCIKKILEIKAQGKTIVLVTHDTGILSRICERAILLKRGRIIKDASVDKTIALSNQAIGAREGVAILTREALSIVFNNGRLFFNWENKLITPGLGAHTVLAIQNKHYNSAQADWVVDEYSENKFVATGRFHHLNVNQIWRLEFDNNFSLKWNIEIAAPDSAEISECYTNIMVVNKYTNWFTGIEKGVFSSIDDKNKNWQSFLDTNISRKLIGVESAADYGLQAPSLIFEHADGFSTSLAQIFNTDYMNDCRVLQYKIAGLNNLLALQANFANAFSGKITFNLADKERYLQQLNQDFVLSGANYRLVFANGAAILSYEGLNLTKNSHLNTSIYVEGKWYDSNSGHWEFKKESRNKIIAYGCWPGLAVKQIWEFQMNSDTGFLWKVWLEVSKEINIQEQRLQFMCIGDYMHYFNDYTQGDFPRGFLETESDMLQRCIPDGVIGVSCLEKQLPDLSLDFSQGQGNFAKVLNADFYNKARLLRIEKVEPEEKTVFLRGKYQSFAIEAKLDASAGPKKKGFANVVEKGRLKFIFEQGKGAIFWDGKELTKKLGFYTALRSQGRWHDSVSSAVWKLQSQDKHMIRARGQWLHLAITQLWEIKLQEDALIEFKVSLQVGNRTAFERLQTNLMLSERYTHWLTEKQKGAFPLFIADITDDWQQIHCAEEKNKFIGVLRNDEDKKCLPDVLFSPLASNSGWLLNILNSDLYHRGRVLQYLNSKNEIIEPGEYPYAHGTIRIEKNRHD